MKGHMSVMQRLDLIHTSATKTNLSEQAAQCSFLRLHHKLQISTIACEQKCCYCSLKSLYRASDGAQLQ
jgi:biotin synthase-like enzyme